MMKSQTESPHLPEAWFRAYDEQSRGANGGASRPSARASFSNTTARKTASSLLPSYEQVKQRSLRRSRRRARDNYEVIQLYGDSAYERYPVDLLFAEEVEMDTDSMFTPLLRYTPEEALKQKKVRVWTRVRDWSKRMITQAKANYAETHQAIMIVM